MEHCQEFKKANIRFYSNASLSSVVLQSQVAIETAPGSASFYMVCLCRVITGKYVKLFYVLEISVFRGLCWRSRRAEVRTLEPRQTPTMRRCLLTRRRRKEAISLQTSPEDENELIPELVSCIPSSYAFLNTVPGEQEARAEEEASNSTSVMETGCLKLFCFITTILPMLRLGGLNTVMK